MGKLTSDDINRLTTQYAPRMGGAQPSALESPAAPQPALSPEDIVARWQMSHSFLAEFIHKEFGNDPALIEAADRALRDGKDGLELIGGHRDGSDASIDELEAGLEVIVQTDGTRPAFLIRDDMIVESSSPPGMWTALLSDVTRQAAIHQVLGSVGRIDFIYPKKPFAGTAWLIAPDLIVTNRHVAQLFVNFDVDGAPVLMPAREPHIDFGHELNGVQSRNRRAVTDLVFCGARHIPSIGIDHTLLDMAVFRIAPAAAGTAQIPLAIGLGEQLATPQTQAIIIGYPAKPKDDVLGDFTETDRVLKLLFGKLWGHKRLSPGEIVPSTLSRRTVSHDASTLGGNSGSLLMGIDTVPLVTGLHYGGQWGGDRVNWAHNLESVLAEPGLAGLRYQTLQDLCTAEGVQLAAPA